MGFSYTAKYDSALAILNTTGYEVVEMDFPMSVYYYSNQLEDVVNFLQLSPYVRRRSVNIQPNITIDDKDVYPIYYWTTGVTTFEYYKNILVELDQENNGYVAEREAPAVATIRVPVGKELEIAEELSSNQAFTYVEPNYLGSQI